MVKPGEKCLSCGEPVEQGEQRCATCLDLAMLVRRLCRRVLKKSCTEEDDVVKAAQDFLRRKGLQGNLLRDHFTEEQPAPSELELPPLPNPITTSKYWDAGIDRPLAGERAARLERQDQLLAAQREIQQLRQRAEDAEAKVRGLSARFICQAELEGGKHAHGHTIQDIYDDRDASDGWTHDC